MLKKLLALSVLLLCGYGQAATTEVTVSRCWEPDGPYVDTTLHGTQCPAQVSGLTATSVTDTTLTFSFSTNKSTTTAYLYVSQLSGTSCEADTPSRTDHIAGTGADGFKTITLSADGSQTFAAVTDLLPETSYCAYVLQVTGALPSEQLIASEMTEPTTPGGGNHPVVDYFVGTGGSDSNNGTSHATRWATLAPVATAQAANCGGTSASDCVGKNINILAGTVISGPFETEWEGTLTDPAEIICYYQDGGVSTACWEGATGGTLDASNPDDESMGSQNLPQIIGTLTDACIKTLRPGDPSSQPNCAWPGSSQYGGAATADCSTVESVFFKVRDHYVHIRGLYIGDTGCIGVQVRHRTITDNSTYDGRLIGYRLVDSVVKNTGGSMHQWLSGIKYSMIKRSILARGSLCYESVQRGGTGAYTLPSSDPSTLRSCTKWFFGAALTRSDSAYSGYNDVTVWGHMGEGLSCGRATKVIQRGVRTLNMNKLGTYLDVCEGGIIESSIHSWNGGLAGKYVTSNGGHARVGLESYEIQFDMHNNLIRNNLFLGVAPAVDIFKEADADVAATLGLHVVHNTFIASTANVLNMTHSRLVGKIVSGSLFQNNIMANPTVTGTQASCEAGFTQGGNLWVSQTGVGTDCKAASDAGGSGAQTDALLTLPVGTVASPNAGNISTWRGYNINNPFTASTVTNARSSATKAGIRLNNVTCNVGTTAAERTEWSYVLDEMDYPFSLDADSSGALSDAELLNWAYCGYYDYDGGTARANTPRIGALED